MGPRHPVRIFRLLVGKPRFRHQEVCHHGHTFWCRCIKCSADCCWAGWRMDSWGENGYKLPRPEGRE